MPSISANSSSSPARKPSAALAVATRIMVQAVRPSMGPGKGHACSSRCVLPPDVRATVASSRAACSLVAWMLAALAAGKSVFGPVPG